MAKDAGYQRTGDRRQPRGTGEPLHPKVREGLLGRMAKAHLAELEAIFEGINEGLLVCDVTGNILRMNRRAREIHGYPSAEEARRTYGDFTNTFDLYDLEGHPIPVEQCPLGRTIRGEMFSETEVCIRDKRTGRKWTGCCTGTPVRDEQGTVTFGVLTFRDMSWRKQAELLDIAERRRAEEALRESERKYRCIVETANEGIWVATPEGKTTYVNPRMAEMLGCSPEEILGRSTLEFIFPEDESAARRELEHWRVGAADRRVCLRCRRRDGSELWAEVSTSTIRGPDGVPRAILRMLTDVTERKRAEEILRESESVARRRLAEIEAIYNSAHVGLCVFDRGLRFVRVNDRLAEINGVPAAEHIGKTAREIIPDLADETEQLAKRILETGEPALKVEFTGTTLAQPGVPRHWIEHWMPLKDDAGRIVGINVVVDEITEFRRMQEALLDNEQRLRMALEAGRMGRWEWDLQTDSSFWCERLYGLLGLDPSVPAESRTFLRLVDKRDRGMLEKLIEERRAEGEDFQAEFRVGAGSGAIRWLALRGRIIRDLHGRAVRIFAVLYDVTERKQMETELRQLNDRLEEQVVQRTEELTAIIDRLQDQVGRRILAEGKLRKHSQMLEGFFQHTIAPLAFMDRHFNFIRVNEAYARADDRTPESFVGKNHFALYPNEENQAIFEQVVRTGRPYFARAKPFIYPDHPERGITYWDWRLTPLLDEFGDVQSLVLNLEDVTQQQVTLRELEQRARQLQKLTLELSQAEDRERKRMADILHDDLQQVLAAARFQLGLLQDGPRSDDQQRQITEQVRQMLKDAIEKSRSLSHELSPAVLSQSDLEETFEWLARQMQSKHGLTVHVEIRGQAELHSEPLRALLYKAAQEMLFNVVKHANVTEARLRLRRVRGQLWLTISDKGRGFDPTSLAQGTGLGLLGIRERVELLGGRMKIRSIEGRGSTLLIAVPDESVGFSGPHDEPPGSSDTPV